VAPSNSVPPTTPTNGTSAAPTTAAPVLDRTAPWQYLGLRDFEEQWCRLRIAHPDLSATAIVRMIPAYASRSRGGQANVGFNLRHNPAIQTRLRQLERDAIRDLEKRKRVKLSGKKVLRELSAVAFSDIRSLLDVEGNDVRIRDSSDWPDAAAAAVASVIKTSEGVKVSLHDKLHALRSLAKVLKLLPEESQHPGAVMIGKVAVYLPDNSRPLQARDDQQAFPFDPDSDPPDPNPNQEDTAQ